MVNFQYDVVPNYQFPVNAPPPANSDGGLKNLSQEGTNALQKGNMWKDSTSVKDNDSISLENTGNEKLPTDYSTLGTYGGGTTLADFEYHAAQVGEVNYSGSGDWGSAYATGSTDFLSVQGRVYGDTGYKDGTVSATGGVQGRVELVGAHYQGGYTSPTLFSFGGHDIQSRTTLAADASVGAAAEADGGIALGKNDYVKVGASGFAGASASLKGSESLGDVAGVNGDARVWAGVGAKVDLDAGYKDGQISFNFGIGAALGIGYDFDIGFSVNVGAIADGVYDGVGDAAEAVGGAAKDVASDIGDAASDVGNAIASLF